MVEIWACLEFWQCGETFPSSQKWKNRTRHILLVHYTKFGWNRSIFRTFGNMAKILPVAQNGKIGLGTSLLVHYTMFGWNRSIFRIWAMWWNFCQLPKMAKIGLGTSYWSIIPSLVEIGAFFEFGQTFASCPKWQNRTRHILMVHYTKFG